MFLVETYAVIGEIGVFQMLRTGRVHQDLELLDYAM